MRHPLFNLRGSDDPPRIIAHRGGPALAPENTLPAIRIAKTLHADAVEIDVRGGRRGEVIVLHDATLERTTTGVGRASAHTAADLRRLDAGRKFDRRFHRVRIPSLRQALAEARPMPLLIEVKEARLVESVMGEVLRARARARAFVMSFDAASVTAAKARHPQVIIGHLVKLGWRGRWWGNVKALVEQALEMEAAFLCVDARGCTERLVRQAHRFRLPVFTWTVDRTIQADRLVAMGVDALITNSPVLLLGRMAQWREWLTYGR